MTFDAPWSAVARGYRHVLVFATLAGIASVVVSVAVGSPLAGPFVCVGLLLGGYNSRRLWSETTRLAVDGPVEGGRRPVLFSSMRRLGFVTFVAAVVAVAYRPLGWTVFLGLLVFQVMLIVNLVGPLRRVIRP